MSISFTAGAKADGNRPLSPGIQVQVDGRFFAALGKILRIAFPAWNSRETLLLGLLVLQLLGRLWVSYMLPRGHPPYL